MSMDYRISLLATLDTKSEESDFFCNALEQMGLVVQVVDISLRTEGKIESGEQKLKAMADTCARIRSTLTETMGPDCKAVVGIGGGTGGEMVLDIMNDLPATIPKVLITSMPFDPRPKMAETSIVIVPTVVDVAGLNGTLRQVLTRAAGIVHGLCVSPQVAEQRSSIGLTALGATGQAAEALLQGLKEMNEECTVFHANGFGGAGFARFAESGAFKAVIDLTCHELTRLHFAGDHVPMANRFAAAAEIPQIVLPGGMNFLGLGEFEKIDQEYKSRPHYQHSNLFTHVKVVAEEMAAISKALAENLNQARAPAHVIVPMGGFSHRDCPGGEIEDAQLRQVCLEVLSTEAVHFSIESISEHINAPATAARILRKLNTYI